MKLLAFSVLDEKSGAFAHPFFVSAVGIATRLFGDWTNKEGTPIAQHPGDYKLYQVGTWDDGKGVFLPCDKPTFVGHALDYVERMPELEKKRMDENFRPVEVRRG